MDSRRKAESADVRAPQLSWRVVLAVGSAAPFVAAGSVAADTDPSVAICHRWLAIDAEQRRLQLEWGTLEGWLMTKRNWYQLSSDQQAAIPGGARLAEIDTRLEVLEVEGHALLKAMRPKPARSIEAVVANLAVAARLVFMEDHPEACGLVTRAVRDLATFSCAK